MTDEASMKSDQVRQHWRDAREHVRTGGTVLVKHYNRDDALIVPADDNIVVLRMPSATQAERLRRLVAEHGALGIPFPNNSALGLRVVDEHGEPVNPHTIPSVRVEVVEDLSPRRSLAELTAELGDAAHRTADAMRSLAEAVKPLADIKPENLPDEARPETSSPHDDPAS